MVIEEAIKLIKPIIIENNLEKSVHPEKFYEKYKEYYLFNVKADDDIRIIVNENTKEVYYGLFLGFKDIWSNYDDYREKVNFYRNVDGKYILINIPKEERELL